MISTILINVAATALVIAKTTHSGRHVVNPSRKKKLVVGHRSLSRLQVDVGDGLLMTTTKTTLSHVTEVKMEENDVHDRRIDRDEHLGMIDTPSIGPHLHI